MEKKHSQSMVTLKDKRECVEEEVQDTQDQSGPEVE